MIAKFMRTIRFYILPVIQAKKTRFIIVSGFIIFFHIIAVLMTTGEFKIDILKGMGISAISYAGRCPLPARQAFPVRPH